MSIAFNEATELTSAGMGGARAGHSAVRGRLAARAAADLDDYLPAGERDPAGGPAGAWCTPIWNIASRTASRCASRSTWSASPS